jgi:hypothetical protein
MIEDDETDDFLEGLSARGYDRTEFSIAEQETTPQVGGIVAITKYILIKRSSGPTKEYRGGHGSTWSADALSDIDAGMFGTA